MSDMTNCAACQASIPLSAGAFTAEGMKCAACAAEPAPMASELMGPAGPMPNKLIVVMVLLGLGVLVNLLAVQLLDVAFGIALMFGIIVGNDGVRRFVVALAWLSLLFAGVGLVFLFSSMDSTLIGLGVFGVVSRIWLIWALSQHDVRNWMFKTAFKDGL